MQELTDKQRRVLRGLFTLHDRTGYPPTVRQLASHLRMSADSAYAFLKALVRKGYLGHGQGRRTLLLLGLRWSPVFEESEAGQRLRTVLESTPAEESR